MNNVILQNERTFITLGSKCNIILGSNDCHEYVNTLRFVIVTRISVNHCMPAPQKPATCDLKDPDTIQDRKKGWLSAPLKRQVPPGP